MDAGYTVYVDDNAHYQDEEYRSTRGVFETWEKAVARCKEIVEASLADHLQPGMTAAQLWLGQLFEKRPNYRRIK